MGGCDSLGFVETIGLVPAIEAADAMVKAARVKVKCVGNADGGLISVICEGDLAACQAAVDAGKAAAARLGKVTTHNLIPRPFDDTDSLIVDYVGSIHTPPAPKPAAKPAAPAKGGKAKK